MTIRRWSFEEGSAFMRDLDEKIAPLGYHAAIYGAQASARVLEIYVYPKVAEGDRPKIIEVARRFGFQLRSQNKLWRPKRLGSFVFHTIEAYSRPIGKVRRELVLYV